MRASEASVPLNMAYLPAIPDLPALKFKDLPREMPEFVIDLIRSLLESMKVCNMYMSTSRYDLPEWPSRACLMIARGI